jgi:hypothetical protein
MTIYLNTRGHYGFEDPQQRQFAQDVFADLRSLVVDGSLGQDHGALTGLADDDHAQYLLADGSRDLAGDWQAGDFDLTQIGNIRGRSSGGEYSTPLTDFDAVLENQRWMHFDPAVGYTTAGKAVGSGQHAYVGMLDSVTTDVAWSRRVPPVAKAAGDSNTLTWYVVWYVNNTSTGNVVWRLRADGASDGDSVGTTFINGSQTAAAAGVTGQIIVDSASTAALDWTAHDHLTWILKRNGGDASDTLATSARLIGCWARINGALDL